MYNLKTLFNDLELLEQCGPVDRLAINTKTAKKLLGANFYQYSKIKFNGKELTIDDRLPNDVVLSPKTNKQHSLPQLQKLLK